MIVKVEGHGKYETLGRTRDDAAGEAFDKVARFLGLGYPGGPVIDKLAKEGDPKAVQFTRPMPDGYDFSFSGLKTGVVNYVSKQKAVSSKQTADIAASFQQAVVDVLVDKAVRAAKDHSCKTIALAGGVSANSQLRTQLLTRCQREGLTAHLPPFDYCTDNAAMIAAAAFHKLTTRPPSSFALRASADKPADYDLQLTIALDLTPVASLRLA